MHDSEHAVEHQRLASRLYMAALGGFTDLYPTQEWLASNLDRYREEAILVIENKES